MSVFTPPPSSEVLTAFSSSGVSGLPSASVRASEPTIRMFVAGTWVTGTVLPLASVVVPPPVTTPTSPAASVASLAFSGVVPKVAQATPVTVSRTMARKPAIIRAAMTEPLVRRRGCCPEPPPPVARGPAGGRGGGGGVRGVERSGLADDSGGDRITGRPGETADGDRLRLGLPERAGRPARSSGRGRRRGPGPASGTVVARRPDRGRRVRRATGCPGPGRGRRPGATARGSCGPVRPRKRSGRTGAGRVADRRRKT